MKIHISDLKNDRQWRAATGLDQKRFEKLLVLFTAAYRDIFGIQLKDRQALGPRSATLSTEQDLLLFTLLSLKSGLTYDMLGFVCGMDSANAHRNQRIGISVLKKALSDAGQSPKREFDNLEGFQEYMRNETTLIFDGTEQRTQRPSDKEYQKEQYSGKKRAYGKINDY